MNKQHTISIPTAIITASVCIAVSIILFTITFFVFGTQSFTYVKQFTETVRKDNAINTCLTNAQFTSEIGNKEGKTITPEPIKGWYEFCMKEKGLN